MIIKDRIHRNILENLTDGVMTIRTDGTIMTFNKAAERILGLAQEDVAGRLYSEVFLGGEENDEFNQAVLDAVHESAIFRHNRVAYHRGDRTRTLDMTASYFTVQEPDGETNSAVVIVFDDATEVEELRRSEETLTEEVEAKHRELTKAYLNLEEANAGLKEALKRVQKIRIGATALIFLLFVGLGFLMWKKSVPASSVPQGSSASREASSTVKTMVVAPQTLTDKITLKGSLKPVKTVNVLSPFGGAVKEVLFRYGQSVDKGQLLMKMDTAEIEVKARDAKVAYIEALENMKKYQRWNQSDEVTKAKRSLTKSMMSLESSKKRYENSEMLYKKEIIPKTELEGDKESYETSKMDYEAAQEEYKSVLAKGTGDQFETIKLKLANAQQKFREIEQQLKQATVYAPVSGTVILPDVSTGQDKKGKTVEKGVSFSQGEILVSIGDTEGVSISATVDETEVIKIKKGMEARIAVDAYPDIALQGAVSYVSSQASKDDMGRKGSSFEISVASDKQAKGPQDKLRLGMSATMDIMILNKPDTIMIPIGAVNTEGEQRTVTVQDKGGKEKKKVKVETGITTLDMVEVVKGLKAGDVIVVP
jgi:HlyD family secretion protein